MRSKDAEDAQAAAVTAARDDDDDELLFYGASGILRRIFSDRRDRALASFARRSSALHQGTPVGQDKWATTRDRKEPEPSKNESNQNPFFPSHGPPKMAGLATVQSAQPITSPCVCF